MAKIQVVVLDGVGMIEKTTSQAQEQTRLIAEPICNAPVTIFALPKPFTGDADRIQRNAFLSWQQLSPAVDVLLFGEEEGIIEFAAEHGIAHGGEIKRNVSGTPLVSSAFSKGHQLSSSPVLVYCNSDVILDKGFIDAMERLSSQNKFDQWLAIGQRTDVEIDRFIDFEDEDHLRWLNDRTRSHGTKSSAVCKEYFAFTRGLFDQIPPFAVGRGNWDNWMVASVKPARVPVIDISDQVPAIHQAHDYAHTNISRMSCYVNGDEARENQRLARGRNLISGSTCTHRLGPNGVEPIGPLRAGVDFLSDLPRFAKLMSQLLLGRQ